MFEINEQEQENNLAGAVTLFIIDPGCIGSTEDAPLPTPSQTAPQADLSLLTLPENFRSGLKLIPPGISWAYFANLKQGTGVEEGAIPSVDFYGTQIIGMLNLEYSENSWIELYDVGKTIPFIFTTKDRTNKRAGAN